MVCDRATPHAKAYDAYLAIELGEILSTSSTSIMNRSDLDSALGKPMKFNRNYSSVTIYHGT